MCSQKKKDKAFTLRRLPGEFQYPNSPLQQSSVIILKIEKNMKNGQKTWLSFASSIDPILQSKQMSSIQKWFTTKDTPLSNRIVMKIFKFYNELLDIIDSFTSFPTKSTNKLPLFWKGHLFHWVSRLFFLKVCFDSVFIYSLFYLVFQIHFVV